MSDNNKNFTLYLEGTAKHHGNVLLKSFVDKIEEIQTLFNKMEKAYNKGNGSTNNKTLFEIVNVEKRNPTSISLNPIAKNQNYNPNPAFEWGIKQIHAVSVGEPVDEKIDESIRDSLIKIATKKNGDELHKFWINGYSETVEFDDKFLENAKRITIENDVQPIATNWYEGISLGSIIGELKAIDDTEEKKEFSIIPHYSPQRIDCVFDENMREEMRACLFHDVKIEGVFHYKTNSPFPCLIKAHTINKISNGDKESLREMRGIFGSYEKQEFDWNELLDD